MQLTADDLKKLKGRCTRAYENGNAWAREIEELYDYALPNRRPSGRAGGVNKRRRVKAHDATAAKAAHRFAGRLARDLTPAFQKFFELRLGPAAIAKLRAELGNKFEDAKESLDRLYEQVSEQAMAIFARAAFATSIEEMYLDLFGGQGALYMPEDKEDILDFVAIPAVEIALRENGRGKVVGRYWKRTFQAGDLEAEEWRDAKFSDALKEKMEKHPDQEVEIVQATEWDHKAKRWSWVVYEQSGKEEDGPISERHDLRTCPLLTPRFYRVPGEAHGRGPGLMALPTIKTLDKVTELTLKAAAFAILGLWIYRNDRSFNPRTSAMRPGNMWQVSSTGGPLGPSVQRLEMPGRYDVSNIILQDLREQVKQITFDDALPPDSGAVRSATEIVERLKRLQTDLSGAYARLVLEVVIPLVKRVLDALDRRDLIDLKGLPIDQLVLKVEVTSPLARAQSAQDVSNLVNWLQIMLTTGGQEMMMLSAKVEDVFADIGRKLGVSETLIRGKAEREELQQMVAQILAANQLQAGAVQPAANDAGAPAGEAGPLAA